MRFVKAYSNDQTVGSYRWVDLFVKMPSSSGCVVDVGFQNRGYQRNVWCSQFFVYDQTQAYLQVCNTQLHTVTWFASLFIAMEFSDEPVAPPVEEPLVAEIELLGTGPM